MLKEGRGAEAAEHLALIPEAVDHAQRELRSVVRRLRPTGLAEFGLADAIDEMIRFWQRRHPDTAFSVDVAPECDGLGEVIETTIYRVVQECLSNALRHGRPKAVAVRIARSDGGNADEVTVTIVDDGPGVAEKPNPGFGLHGMSERVRAIGGNLTLANRPDGGLGVTAILPCRPERDYAVIDGDRAR
jgi:two-component system sensor histidine kinase UhpB